MEKIAFIPLLMVFAMISIVPSGNNKLESKKDATKGKINTEVRVKK